MLLEFLCTDMEDFRRRVAEVSLRAYASSSSVCLKELLIQRVLTCLLCSSDETINRYSRPKSRLRGYLILMNSWISSLFSNWTIWI